VASRAPLSDRLRRRRRFWFGFCIVALAYVAWAWIVGLAFTTGMPAAEMDWDADGAVTNREILQSAYAVTAQTTRTPMTSGLRVCRSYRWLGHADAQPIRVSCRTDVAAAAH